MKTVLAITLTALICAGCTAPSTNNSSHLRKITAACGTLPLDADTSKPEESIIRWCSQGLYLAKGGALLPLVMKSNNQESSTPWDGGDMPTIETSSTASKQPSKVEPIVLEIPTDE